MKMRDACRRTAEEVKVPEALARTTLQSMLEENQRFREEQEKNGMDKDVACASSAKEPRWLTAADQNKKKHTSRVYMLASMAAMLLIAVGLGAFLSRPHQVPFYQFALSALPVDTAPMRAGDGPALTQEDFEAQLGVDLAGMVPGYHCVDSEIRSAYDAPAKIQGQIATCDYESGNLKVRLTVTTFDTVVMTAIRCGQPLREGAVDLFFGRDTDGGSLYAVWTKGAAHCLLESASLNESTFVSLARAAARR